MRIAFRGQGEKTVDEQQIVERFGQLGIQLDWSPLRKLTSHRNVLEHYRYLGSREELREVVAQSATMIRRLFDVLGLDPVDILDADCWEFLLENEAVFQEELARSRASIQMMRWRSPTMARAAITDLSCINCRSELLELENPDNVDQETARLKCRACGWTFSAKERIWPTLVQYFGQDLYEAATQGGLPPVFKCDVCREVAVVAQEGECACCGKSGYELRCEVCNASCPAESRPGAIRALIRTSSVPGGDKRRSFSLHRSSMPACTFRTAETSLR